MSFSGEESLQDIFDKGFEQFVTDLHALTDNVLRQRMVDKFMRQIKNSTYPLFENDTTAILLHQGDVNTVTIIGDMTCWADEIAFRRVYGTNLFYFIQKFESDARVEYLIKTDKMEQPGPDPLNSCIVHNGFGPNSELAMPGYQKSDVFNSYAAGQKGEYSKLEKLEIHSRILAYAHEIFVYTPPEYTGREKAYPTIYIQDGRDYIEFAVTPVVIEDLISSNQIEPVIAVFINPPNRHLPDQPNRMTEYGLNDNYVNFMADELAPFIASKFRTKNQPDSRLVVGDSFGGLISAYVPFFRHDVFGLGYSQSGYLSFEDDKLIKEFQAAERKQIKLFVDIGVYETIVGADLLPQKETDFLSANRRFNDVLRQKKYDFVYREYPEGHTWGNWRRHIIDALIHFFPLANQ